MYQNMAQKSKSFEVNIVEESGTFNYFFRRFTREQGEYEFEALSSLRKLLSNEKAKIMHVIKTKKPKSMYELAKFVGRDFKSVSDDISLLKRFGLVEMIAEKTGKRERLKPVLTGELIYITIKI